MGVIETYKSIRTKLAKEVRLFTTENTTSVDDMPMLPNWFWHAKLGVPRGADINQLRSYAKSPWVLMVKNAIKKQLMTTPWQVINSDEEDKTDYSEDIKRITTFLNYPNRNGQTFWELWGAFVDDILDLDAGVIYKGRNYSNELTELYSFDGSRFLFKIDEHGIIDGFYQYSYQFPKNQPIFFDTDEIIYGKIGINNSEYPYGWSPLQSIQQEVEVMIQSTRYNKEFFKNNATPDGIVSIPMQTDALERFKAEWEQQIKGKPHKLLFHNSEAAFTPLSNNNKDMEWLAGQKWYFHTVFGVFGLSPAEVGFYEDVNRSAQEGQERTTLRNAIKPYFKLIEDKINRDILPEILKHDSIKFEFIVKDDVTEKLEHDQTMAKLNASVLTINEVRKREGLDPVEWGDKPIAMVMQDTYSDSENKNQEDKEFEKTTIKYKESFKSFFKEINNKESFEYKRSFKSFIKNGKL